MFPKLASSGSLNACAKKDWPHQVLILGPSTRRVDVIPLHHKAISYFFGLKISVQFIFIVSSKLFFIDKWFHTEKIQLLTVLTAK